MKICPFISHMLGEDHAGVLEIQDNSTLASGANDAKGKDAPTEAAAPGHLFCLKDTCRFYRKQDAECSFDVAFEHAEVQAKSVGKAIATQKTLDTVTKELGKFWTLQTKSVAELIESIGESEKNSTEALARLETSVSRTLEDAISAKISQMATNFEDRLTELRDRTSDLSQRIESLGSSQPGGDDIRQWITESLSSSEDSGVSESLDTIREEFQSFVSSSSRFEEKLDEWQKRFDTRVDEIRDGQQEWATSLEELANRKPAEVAEDDGMAERKKKARKLNNLGVTSFHNGELEQARDQFKEAVSLDDTFAECYNNLGLVYTELDENTRATAAFSAAIKLNPELHAAYNNLGYAFYKQGSYDEAIEMYNEALGRSTSNSSAYTNLGNAYFKQDRREDARKAWEKALELDPSNRQASSSLQKLDREKV